MKRNVTIDFLKVIAIFLVIIGHCIQYGSGHYFASNELFFSNILFSIIYSFHMPLFMLISGFLFYKSIKKYNIKELLKKKTFGLIIPIISFSILDLIFQFILKRSLSLSDIISIFITKLWFLWAVYILSIIVILNVKCFKDSILFYLLLFIATFFLPSFLNLELYGYMYLYFIIGYLFCKYELFEKFNNKREIIIMITLIPIYIFLFSMYNYDSYIYTTGMSVINNISQLYIDLYRFLIGLVGSAFVIITIKNVLKLIKIKSNKLIITISNNTLGIYAISNFIFVFMKKITYNLFSINYLYLLVESIITLFISILLINILEKNKLLTKLFLGR